MKHLCASLPAVMCLLPALTAVAAPFPDTLVFGDTASEQAHGLTAAPGASDVVDGGAGAKARRLLPPPAGGWEGGALTFDLTVAPAGTTYLTATFWGGDTNPNLLILSCEGKQIGYRHLGDVEILDLGTDDPSWPGRFTVHTTPLPEALTRGRTSVRCEIRATGPIWGYGATFDRYQQPMREPSRGLYRIQSHTDPCVTPDPSPATAPAQPSPATTPGPEVIDAVKERCSEECRRLLRRSKPLDQLQLWFLTRAWRIGWTPAFRHEKVPPLTRAGVDALWRSFRRQPEFATADPVVYNKEWFGMALAAESVWLVNEALASHMDEPVTDDAGASLPRRQAWADLFVASRDWLRGHRRAYTNQSMIVDLNIQRLNRCLSVIAPDRALPAATTLRYLREAVGLEPWLGSETPTGPARPLGDAFFQVTAKGLTRELGYVGTYGEVQDWVTHILDSTRPTPGAPGDPDIARQLAKMTAARAIFRHPSLDAEGRPLMRLETRVGWRDVHFPGPATYVQRMSFDAGMFAVTAALRREPFTGWSQQALADGQLFPAVAAQLQQRGLRVTTGLLDTPDEYTWLKAQPASTQRLPMSGGMPDFAWADEEAGVVAVKSGTDVFHASLWWRARHGVNRLARIHWLNPQFEQVATVRTTVEFEPAGLTYRRPKDWTNAGFGNGLFRYPGRPESAHGGEELPVSRIPDGVPFKPGQESPFAGRIDLCTLRHGPWWIAMNLSAGRTFTVTPPADVPVDAVDLIGGQPRQPGVPFDLPPRTTVVLRAAR